MDKLIATVARIHELEDERAAIIEQLPPALVPRFRSFMADHYFAETDRLTEMLAAHLPGMAPAIRGLADHILNGDPESGCCGLPASEGPSDD